MLIHKILLVALCFVMLGNAPQAERGWRGIIPLHSTRSDVENLLGHSEDKCNCIYKNDDYLVVVEYSQGHCKGSPSGWNVPAETVLSIRVRSQTVRTLAELNIDLTGYTKVQDDTFSTYYTNNEQGITYEATQSGVINAVTYTPSTKDNVLRCPGWPLVSAREGLIRPRSFDDYSDIPWSRETARLDSFAVYLHQQTETVAYVIVFAGRRSRVGEALARANRVKNYLENKRGISTSRIVIMDGGFREALHVELYALPRDVPAPTPYPTVAPREVQPTSGRKSQSSGRLQ